MLGQEVKEKILGYLTAAFGLVVGLAWNDAIKALIDSLYPSDQAGIIAKFIYAIVLTIVLIIGTNYLVKFFNRQPKQE